MKVAESIESLFHDHSCLSLSKVLLLSDVVEQFSSLAYSKHQKMRIRTKCHSSAINLLTDSSYRDGQASSLHQYSNWIIRDWSFQSLTRSLRSISFPFPMSREAWWCLGDPIFKTKRLQSASNAMKLLRSLHSMLWPWSYQLLENGDLILERFIVLDSPFLHRLNCYFHAYTKSCEISFFNIVGQMIKYYHSHAWILSSLLGSYRKMHETTVFSERPLQIVPRLIIAYSQKGGLSLSSSHMLTPLRP